MLMGLAEQARCISGTCVLPAATLAPSRASEADLAQNTEGLLSDLGGGADFRAVRDRAWSVAEAVRNAETSGQLPRARALVLYDLVSACWTAADRMAAAWHWLEMGEPAESLQAASSVVQRVDELEALLGAATPPTDRLRGRIQALLQLADGLDEAAFLGDCGDPGAARERANRALGRLAELLDLGRLNPDEQDVAEAAAARWGARSRDPAGRNWAS